MHQNDQLRYPFSNDCWFRVIIGLSKIRHGSCPESVLTIIDELNKDLIDKEEKEENRLILGEPMPKDLIEAVLLKFDIAVKWEEYKNGILIESYIMNEGCTLIKEFKVVFTYNENLIGHYELMNNLS